MGLFFIYVPICNTFADTLIFCVVVAASIFITELDQLHDLRSMYSLPRAYTAGLSDWFCLTVICLSVDTVGAGF